MNDSKFKKKLTSLIKAQNRARELLVECEDEYISRYGVAPGDIDDDDWIETYHGISMSDESLACPKRVDQGATMLGKVPSFYSNNKDNHG